MVTSKIRHRFYDRDGNEHVLNATSDDQGKITDEYSVEYADENAFAMGHTTSRGIIRTNANGWKECEILVEYADENEHKKHWFPLDMQTVGWLPLDMRKP